MYILFLIYSSVLFYHKSSDIVDIVPCAIQQNNIYFLLSELWCLMFFKYSVHFIQVFEFIIFPYFSFKIVKSVVVSPLVFLTVMIFVFSLFLLICLFRALLLLTSKNKLFFVFYFIDFHSDFYYFHCSLFSVSLISTLIFVISILLLTLTFSFIP